MGHRQAGLWFFCAQLRHHRVYTALLIAIVLVGVNGCSLAYYTQAISGQMKVLGQREPIESLLDDPDTDADLKDRLRRVLEIRNFASDILGLPENGSYRYYADLQRPYAVWNVFAAPEFSIVAVDSCFLVIGCVAYRGYFKESSAQRYAQKMAKKGNDVYVAGVSAYSTLGRFNDPVFNTMIYWDEWQLAGVIFHELAHQWLYVKGDSAFSEAFATVVEEYSVGVWLESQRSGSELADYQTRRASQAIFATINSATRDELRVLYASDLPQEQMKQEKSQVFSGMKKEFRRLSEEHPDFENYAAFFDQDLNNAHLVSVATYYDLLPDLRCLLRENASNQLDVFLDLATELAAYKDKETRREQLHAITNCTADLGA
jgi:predicted aminopeptidase